MFGDAAVLVQAEHYQPGEVGVGYIKGLVYAPVDFVVPGEEDGFLLQVLFYGLFGCPGHKFSALGAIPVSVEGFMALKFELELVFVDVSNVPVLPRLLRKRL